MSHLGYVIEQLINEDEKSRIAREHRRKRRLAGAAARNRSTPAGSAAKRSEAATELGLAHSPLEIAVDALLCAVQG